MEVTLITGRTIGQGITIEEKCEEEYAKEAAICELCMEDMEKSGIKEGNVIRVTSKEGEVCVFAKASDQLDEGLAFIPLGIWANIIIPEGTDSTGTPAFKGIKVRIELAKDEKVLNAKELIRRHFIED